MALKQESGEEEKCKSLFRKLPSDTLVNLDLSVWFPCRASSPVKPITLQPI